jgi:dTDP-4-dehydrorhamnose reductase
VKILLFGSTGQVGSSFLGKAEIETVNRSEANLENPISCFEKILESKPDLVINTAAFTSVDMAEEQIDLVTLVNGIAPVEMSKAAASLKIPFIHLSSEYVFSGVGQAPWCPTDSMAPLNAYGRSKQMAENGIKLVGGVHVILRTSWVFSVHNNNFVKKILKLAKSNNNLSVVSDQIGGPTAAEDISEAILKIGKMIIKNKTLSGTYHYSGQEDITRANFAREILSQAGEETVVTDVLSSKFRPNAERPLNSRLDCSKTFDTFGVERPDWKHGLHNVLGSLGVI